MTSEGYDLYQCPECQFDFVLDANGGRTLTCPLCASDSGHEVVMTRRPAQDTDQPEGFDARTIRQCP